ncbi:MAG: M24 family metallopeptidase C-terminal domain-containing protein [Alphaproteobacteria bacterium]
MLKFEPLTLVPIDKRLINKYLLNHHETAWLNQYHRRVFEEISPLLEPELQQWLEKACAPL